MIPIARSLLERQKGPDGVEKLRGKALENPEAQRKPFN